FIGAAVIDAGNTAAMAAEMVERGLDHVRLDADVSHFGRGRSANVMDAPWIHSAGETLVDFPLAPTPRSETNAGAIAKQPVARAARDRLDDLERGRRQHDRVGAAVLRALLRQRPRAGLEIEFRLRDAANFLTTTAEQDQKADDLAEVVIAGRAP